MNEEQSDPPPMGQVDDDEPSKQQQQVRGVRRPGLVFPAAVSITSDDNKYRSKALNNKVHFTVAELKGVLQEIALDQWGANPNAPILRFLAGSRDRKVPHTKGELRYQYQRCTYFNQSRCPWQVKVYSFLPSDGGSTRQSFVVFPTNERDVSCHDVSDMKRNKSGRGIAKRKLALGLEPSASLKHVRPKAVIERSMKYGSPLSPGQQKKCARMFSRTKKQSENVDKWMPISSAKGNRIEAAGSTGG